MGISNWWDGILHPGTKKIVVSKGWCTPARDTVLTAMKNYGVKVLDYEEEVIEWPGVGPVRIDARVRVKDEQAVWAEYLLLRTGKLRLRSKPLNQRNREWAERHGGQMPPAWEIAAGRWREKGCKSG